MIMSRGLRHVLAALAGLGWAAAASAADVVLGQWNEDFTNSLAYAEANGVPLVVFWGHLGCSHCNWFKNNVKDSPALASWLAEHPVVMVFKDDEKWNTSKYARVADWLATCSADYRGAYEWIGSIKSVSSFPKIGVYWKKSDGTVVAKDAFEWFSQEAAAKFVDKLDSYFSSYSRSVQFVVGTTPCDRLEAVAGTSFVEVPLRRSWSSQATSWLVAELPNGAIVTNEVAWTVGQLETDVRVDIPDAAFAVGAGVTLRLTDEDWTAEQLSQIAFVDEPANSPKNPRWIGERDLDTLAAGEWTMDLELVKARAAARGRPALVLVGGSLWCPDCVKTDHYLVDTEPFKAWLAANDVSCAAIDVPTVSADGTVGRTSLLTYAPTTVSDRYVNATDPQQERVQSGAGYLSRHQVPQTGNGGTNAAEIAARNLALMNGDTAHGGLCRPENLSRANAETQRWKTGIPCLVMLRPDGTVAGRLFQFNNVSPGDTSALGAYLERMNELVALCDEPAEEDNADWRTTADVLETNATVEASLSALDRADWYRLPPVAFLADGAFSVKATTAASDTTMMREDNVQVALWRVGETTNEVASAKGSLFSGVTLPAALAADGADWYVAVKAIDSSKTFLLERAETSVTGYALTADLGCHASAPVFERAALAVEEKTAGSVAVRVLREGGGAGALRATVRVNAEATDAAPESYEWEDVLVEWADGDSEAKTVTLGLLNDAVWDGDRTIVLELVDVTGDFVAAEATGPTALSVTVKEDDKKAVGKLAIAATDPAMSKAMTVVAREGSVLGIAVERLDGASQSVTCDVATAKGLLSSNVLVWAHRDRTPVKWVDLEMPTLAELGSKKSFAVTIVPHKGISAEKSKRKLTVSVVAADAPGFEVDTRRYAIRRYVSFSDEIAVDQWKGGRLVLKKLSGSLPTGVKAKLKLSDSVVSLALSGTPTKAKNATVVYQIVEERPKADPTKVGAVAGTTVRLVFSVSDVTVTGKDGQAANAFVAKTRTFGEIPVVDDVAGVLAGRLSVTVPKTGKASAKYLCRAGTISFSSSAWSACDDVTGELRAVLKPKKAGYALAVTVAADGSLGYELDDVGELSGPVSGTARLAPWNKTTKLAKPWTGYYTVDCPATNLVSSAAMNVPTGDVYLTLKMNTSSAVNAGRMSYAGRLANGKTFSGSSLLVDRGETAGLPVSMRSATDFFTAYADISANAAAAYVDADEHRTVLAVPGVVPRWRHDESWSADESYAVAYGLYGAYYYAKEDIEGCAREPSRFAGVPLVFATDGAAAEVPVNVSAKGPYVDGPNGIRLTMKFKRATGILTGTFTYVPEGATAAVKANYAGILLPGWGGCGACAPGEVFRPLFAGSFWRTQKVVEVTAAGKRKTRSVVRGGPISIGESEEEEEQ